MKRGIEISWGYDYKDHMVLQIVKKRGKLTLEEIQDLLMYEEGQRYCGHYAILLNCSEGAIGGNTFWRVFDRIIPEALSEGDCEKDL